MNISLIDLSVFMIAVAFLVLVYYIIKTLKAIQKSAEEMNQGLIHINSQIDVIGKETTELLQNTNKLTVDLQEKSKSLDSIFQSIDDVGSAVQQVTASARQVSSSLADTVQRSVQKVNSQQNKLDEWLKYFTLGLSVWEKMKHKREEKNNGRR